MVDPIIKTFISTLEKHCELLEKEKNGLKFAMAFMTSVLHNADLTEDNLFKLEEYAILLEHLNKSKIR